MDKNTKKAILVVSFGTSVNETREKTIDCIEADIREANPDASIYRAWTSKMIIRKLKNRDGITIHTVKEAMEAMIRDGIKELIVQPTHIINGIENDLMKEDVLAYADHFDSIRFGPALRTSRKLSALSWRTGRISQKKKPLSSWATAPPIMPILPMQPLTIPSRIWATPTFSSEL